MKIELSEEGKTQIGNSRKDLRAGSGHRSLTDFDGTTGRSMEKILVKL
jgi:hypothetical protein